MTTLDPVSFAPFLFENQHLFRFVLFYDACYDNCPFNCRLSYFCCITVKNSKNIFQFNGVTNIAINFLNPNQRTG